MSLKLTGNERNDIVQISGKNDKFFKKAFEANSNLKDRLKSIINKENIFVIASDLKKQCSESIVEHLQINNILKYCIDNNILSIKDLLEKSPKNFWTSLIQLEIVLNKQIFASDTTIKDLRHKDVISNLLEVIIYNNSVGSKTLKDILEIPLEELKEDPLFNDSCLREYKFLEIICEK